MSLYKVISNYYIDMLDYLNEGVKEYGTIDEYFNNIKDEPSKRAFMVKVCTLFQRLDILARAENSYYQQSEKTNLFYFVIIILLLAFTLCIMIYFFMDNLKNFPEFKKNAAKNAIVYCLSYMLMFTFFYLILYNVNATRIQNKNRRNELNSETLTKFYNLIGIGSDQLDLKTTLVYIGYAYTQSKSQVDLIERGLVKYEDMLNKLKKYKSGYSVNFVAAYDDNVTQLKDAFKKFYEGDKVKGKDGYTMVREAVVTSSNILILKEINSIMKEYYKIAKLEPGVNLDEQQEIVNKLIVDKYVIKELSLLNEDSLSSQNKAVDIITTLISEDGKAVTEQMKEEAAISLKKNLDSSAFKAEHDFMVQTYLYLVTYMYQLHVGVDNSDVAFPSTIKSHLPMLINLSTIDQNSKSNYEYIKSQFTDNHTMFMKDWIERSKTLTEKTPLYAEALGTLVPLFDNQYIKATILITGRYYMLYDYDYMMAKLNDLIISKSLGTELSKLYMDTIKNVLKSYFFPECVKVLKSRIADVEYLERAFISRIAANLVTTNISVAQYSSYIVSQLGSIKEMNENLSSMYTNIITKIDQEVKKKRQNNMKRLGEVASLSRFKDLETFIKTIDDYSYNDFKYNLDISFLKEITEEFYNSVSRAVYDRNKYGTIKDIHFEKRKNIKMLQQALSMIGVILCLCLVYFYISVVEDQRTLKKQIFILQNEISTTTDGSIKNEKKELLKEYKNMQIDIFIKYAIPGAAFFFIVALMISYYKKVKDTHEFNKETIDSNTFQFKTSINDLNDMFAKLDKNINIANRNQKIKDLTIISIDDKTDVHKSVLNIIDKFEKCNYVIVSAKAELPFPYTDVIIDSFMIAITLLCILYIVAQFRPITRIDNIKELNKLLEKGQYLDGDETFKQEVKDFALCHDQEIDSIIFTLKIIFFVFIFMFLIFYSSKILASSNDFMYGLYNSMYFEESRCYE